MRLVTTCRAAQAAASLVLLAAPLARGGDAALHPLGPHPAVIVQRLQQSAGYDYASKFYPHPAWLYLSATPPQDGALAAAAAGTAPDSGAAAPTAAARRSSPPSPSTRRPS